MYICVFSIYVLYARFISIMGGKLHNPACDSLQATSINDIESHCSDFPIQSKNRNVYMYRLEPTQDHHSLSSSWYPLDTFDIQRIYSTICIRRYSYTSCILKNIYHTSFSFYFKRIGTLFHFFFGCSGGKSSFEENIIFIALLSTHDASMIVKWTSRLLIRPRTAVLSSFIHLFHAYIHVD